jgi:hypothetical protein
MRVGNEGGGTDRKKTKEEKEKPGGRVGKGIEFA